MELDKRALDDWIQREPYTPPPCEECEFETCGYSDESHPCPTLLKFYEEQEKTRRRIEG